MAITKTTRLLKVEVFPGDDSQEAFEPFLSVHLEDMWDDTEDDDLPIVKTRRIRRGRMLEEHGRTDISDLPELAQDIARKIWRY